MNNFPYHESVDLNSKNSNINTDLDSLHHRQSTYLAVLQAKTTCSKTKKIQDYPNTMFISFFIQFIFV